MPKIESKKRKVIFCLKTLLFEKLKANLILFLNKSLQKIKISAYIQFNWVKYLQSKTISALFRKKFSIKQLVDNYSNIFIKITQIVIVGVIGIKTLERWQRLKIYEILLTKYLEKKNKFILLRD